jgi:hypothetical protein
VKRLLLPLAMAVSLWPVGFIGVSLGMDSNSSDAETTNVEVTVPSEVTTPDAVPTVATVQLKLGGKTYSCPPGTDDKLKPMERTAGATKLKLTATRRALRSAGRRLKALDKLYPGNTAPTQAIADGYNGTLRRERRLDAREGRLVRQYNRAIDARNAVLDSDCS